MIRSVAHPQTRAWHRAHRPLAPRMDNYVGIMLAAVALIALGYFTQVDWVALGDALC